jgi:gas vesicle protein
MSNESRQAVRVAALIAGGAVVGAGLGLLFAPQSGAETRRDVARYAKRAQIRAARVSRAIRDRTTEVFERGKMLVQKNSKPTAVEAA